MVEFPCVLIVRLGGRGRKENRKRRSGRRRKRRKEEEDEEEERNHQNGPQFCLGYKVFFSFVPSHNLSMHVACLFYVFGTTAELGGGYRVFWFDS